MRGDRARKRLDRLVQPLELLLALLARHQMALEHLRLELGQRAEGVRADVLGVVGMRAHAIAPASSRRSLSSPSRIRPFTVPTGSSSISAIWLCVKPPK